MTHDRWTNGDSELTNALRVLYAAPEGESYWDALEARSAYATLITPSPSSVEPSTRAASVGDGDMAIHLLLSR